MKIFDFIELFGTERKCLDWVKKHFNILCPNDLNSKIYIRSNNSFCCSLCKSTISFRKGTFLSNSKLPLYKWFMMFYEFWISRNGLTAIKLSKLIDVSYKVAWSMLNRVRTRLNEIVNDFSQQFVGITEMDDAFFTFKIPRNFEKKRRGRSLDFKSCVLGFVNRETKKVKFFVGNNSRLDQVVEKLNIVCDTSLTHLMTDGYKMFRKLNNHVKNHSMVNHMNYEWVKGQEYTQTIENFWKHTRRLLKTHVRWSEKYLENYIAESAYKWNNKNSFEQFVIQILKP